MSADPAALKPSERWLYVALAVLIAASWFAALSARPLFNPDEGRYAEIPREMLAGSGWIVPHLDGVPYVEKPPLTYWMTALALRTFGLNAFAARLYSTLCGIGTLLLVGFTAGRLWNTATGWRAAALLGGMALTVILAQLLTLDMSLTFYLTLSLAAFLAAQHARAAGTPEAARRADRWMLAAWAAVALGVLTKGVVALAIPGATLVLYSAVARDLALWRRLALVRGLALFAVLVLPWHLLAARRLDDFLGFYFVHEHLARYLTPSADREEARWFFLAVFALGTAPWSIGALRSLALDWRRGAPRGEFNAARFLWLWMAFVILFFSLSDSKLIPYVLPAFPPLALLLASAPPATLRRDLKLGAAFALLVGVALVVAGVALPAVLAPSPRHALFFAIARPAMLAGALFVAGGLAVLAPRDRPATRDAVTLGAAACLGWLILMRAAAVVAPAYSGVALAAPLAGVPAAVPVYSVGTYDHTLSFYARRTLLPVAYRGELDYGLRHVPGMAIADLDSFIDRWNAGGEAYAVMELSTYERLRARGVPMREVARNLRRVLVARS